MKRILCGKEIIALGLLSAWSDVSVFIRKERPDYVNSRPFKNLSTVGIKYWTKSFEREMQNIIESSTVGAKLDEINSQGLEGG